MLQIVQVAAYMPFAAIFFFTIILRVAPLFGSGHIDKYVLDAALTGFSWLLTVAAMGPALIGALVFRNRSLAIMFISTALVAGHLTGRGALLPIPQVVGMTAWCLITTAVFAQVVMVDMQGRHMFWTRWDND